MRESCEISSTPFFLLGPANMINPPSDTWISLILDQTQDSRGIEDKKIYIYIDIFNFVSQRRLAVVQFEF